jgi:DNA processing protein
MTLKTALRWSWMNVLTRKRAEALAGEYGDLEKALEQVSVALLRAIGCKEETAMATMNRLEEFDPDAYMSVLKKRGIRFLSMEESGYPAELLNIPDSPVFLYSMGDLDILAEPCLALVGAREMSDYGKRVVAHLVPDIVRSGVVTVSGLAFGIDAEVARETLHAGGKTVAVLGHGLGMIYPKANERLAKEIVEKGGLVLSEFPLDVQPDKFTFPARNRIIAGLSLGTVVVEAAADSGSLITAELALEYGRDVFAVPGQIFDDHYVGCHELLSRGHAKLVSSAADILQEIGVVVPESRTQAPSFESDSAEEQAVFSALTTMPASLDDLAVRTKLDAATLSATLTVLEIKSGAKNIGGGKWVRV